MYNLRLFSTWDRFSQDLDQSSVKPFEYKDVILQENAKFSHMKNHKQV